MFENSNQIEKREIFYVNDDAIRATRTTMANVTRVKSWRPSTKKKSSPKSTFLHDIRTVLKVIRAIGLYPAQIISSMDDSESTQTSVGWLFYSSCLYAFILYHVFHISIDYVTRLMSPTIAFNASVYLFGNFLIIHTFTLIPFTHWLYWRKYDRLIKIWAQFLMYYETKTNRRPRQQTKIIVRRGFLTGISIIIVLSVNVFRGVPGKTYIIFELWGLVTIFTLTTTFYSLFCQNIRDVADDLVSVIRQSSAQSSVAFVTQLDKSLQMWIRLSKIMDDVIAVFSLNLNVALFVEFCSAALASFGQVIKILNKHNFSDSSLMSFAFLCFDSVGILVACNVSHKTTKHMGKKLRKEILLCNLTDSGFVEVQQIYSSLATYMIVLVQFQLTLMYHSF